MGDALRRMFLSIAIALGLASGQPDPGLFARLSLDGGSLVVSARIENAFAPGTLELVEAGTRVALRFSARASSPGKAQLEAEETRTLWYDLRSGRYHVAYDGGKTAALDDPGAARTLASELSRLAICGPEDLAEGSRVLVSAEIGIIDSKGAWHDAPVLWNYFGPRAILSYVRENPGMR